MATPAAKHTLETLPLEILQKIIAPFESYPKTLDSFRLVSRQCELAAEAIKFRECKIKGNDWFELSKSLEKLKNVLLRRRRNRRRRDRTHRRRKCAQNRRKRKSCRRSGIPNRRQREPKFSTQENGDQTLATLSCEQDFVRYSRFRYVKRLIVSGLSKELPGGERFFEKLCDLLGSLSGLKHFYFALNRPFPRNLLDKLETMQNVSLHLRPLYLENPAQGPTENELPLITSRRLQTVGICAMDRGDGDNDWHYLLETGLEMASSLSPSLEFVHIVHRQSGFYDTRHRQDALIKLPRNSLHALPKSTEKGPVLALVIDSAFWDTDERTIPRWLARVNAETLVWLKISFPSGGGVLPTAWPDSTCLFPALRMFELDIPDNTYRNLDTDLPMRAEIQAESVARFLKRLPKLRMLSLKLVLAGKALFNAIDYHASTLRQFTMIGCHNESFDYTSRFMELLKRTGELRQLVICLRYTDEVAQRTRLCNILSRLHYLGHVAISEALPSRGVDLTQAEESSEFHLARAKSHWKALVNARGNKHGDIGWAMTQFKFTAGEPATRYERKRDWFEFRGVAEEIKPDDVLETVTVDAPVQA